MFQAAFSVWLAQLGGIGKSPYAPGTVATILVGLPAAYLLGNLPLPFAISALLVLFAVACLVSGATERLANRSDPKEIVIDELVGFLVTMLGQPLSWTSLGMGLLLFRLFDILKPWPIRLLDRKAPGGIWIVLDDVAAGCYARLALWFLWALWP